MPVFRGFYKVQEEMGELNQVMGKLATCLEGKYWDGTDLVPLMEQELVDVMATIIYFVKTNNLKFDEDRLRDKLTKFEQWGLTGIIPGEK